MNKQRGVIAFILALFMFMGIYISLLQRLIGEIAIQYKLDNSMAGLTVTMIFIGYFISPMLTGEVTDRFGRKIMLLCAFIIFLAGLGLTLAWANLYGVMAGLLVTGMGFGILEMTLSSLITDIRPGQANRILNLSRLFLAFGTVSGPFIAMAVLGWTRQWQTAILISLGILGLFFLVFIFLSFPKARYPERRIEEKEERSITGRLLKNGTVMVLGLTMLMYLAAEAGLTYNISRYMQAWDIQNTGLYSSLTLSVFWGCMAVGRFVCGRFSKKLSAVIAVLAGIGCIGLTLCLITDGLVPSIISFGIMGLGLSAMFPTVLAIGKILFPKYSGTVFGILITSAGLGGILMPYIMGAIHDAGGAKISLASVFVPLAVILATQTALAVRERKKGIRTAQEKVPEEVQTEANG